MVRRSGLKVVPVALSAGREEIIYSFFFCMFATLWSLEIYRTEAAVW
jgi:hypothetical protein